MAPSEDLDRLDQFAVTGDLIYLQFSTRARPGEPIRRDRRRRRSQRSRHRGVPREGGQARRRARTSIRRRRCRGHRATLGTSVQGHDALLRREPAATVVAPRSGSRAARIPRVPAGPVLRSVSRWPVASAAERSSAAPSRDREVLGTRRGSNGRVGRVARGSRGGARAAAVRGAAFGGQPASGRPHVPGRTGVAAPPARRAGHR